MRAFSMIVLSLLIAGGLWAQDQPSPNGQFYGQLVSGSWTSRLKPTVKPRPVFLAAPTQPAPACAVPLLKMEIPQDVEFTIRKAPVVRGFLADRSVLRPRVPACDDVSNPSSPH